DVNVARALEVRPAADDVVVAADARGPLIVRGTRGDHRFVALAFDVRESDLPLRPAFPLLLLDAIESFAPSDAAYRGSVVTGAAVSVASFVVLAWATSGAVEMTVGGDAYALAEPRALCWLALLPIALAAASRSLADLPPPQLALSAAVRALVVTALAIGLAQP